MKDNNFILLDEDGGAAKAAEGTVGAESKQMSQGQDDQRENSNGLKLEEKIKVNLFNVFCHLLKGGLEISSWKVYLILFVEFV
jgi:hypothetical protein